MREFLDGNWLVIEFVPELIVAHGGIQFGEPTIMGTRISTAIAGGSWYNKEWDDYGITEEQAFAALCFEAGRQYQRSRTLRKKIDDAAEAGWAKVKKE